MQIRMLVKYIFYLVLLVASAADAQTEKAVPQQMTKTNSGPLQGTLIVEGVSKIGTMGLGGVDGNVEVDCKEDINSSDGTRRTFISLTVQSPNFGPTGTASVDYDEVDSLIKGIEYLERLDKSISKLDSVSAEFHINDELWIQTSVPDQGEGFILGTRNALLPLAGKGDLEKFRSLVEAAKQKLEEIRK